MRLFLIKNVSRDPKYARRRRANPLHVTKTPSILGHRLYPRTSLQISESDLDDAEIASINAFIKAGVITVSVLGGEMHIQSIDIEIDSVDVQEELLEVSEPLSQPAAEQPAPEVVEEPQEEPSEEVIEEPEPSPVEIAEIVEEDEEDSSKYSKSDLVKMKNSELRELLSIIDPDFPSAGVKKSILVDRVLEMQ